MKTIRSLAVLTLLLLPGAVSAQVATSAASGFVGNWSLSFESPQGALVIELVVTDNGGNIAATIGSQMMGGPPQNVTDISMSGTSLVFRYELDAQGQMVPVALSVAPDGTAEMDFADGMFTMPGSGTKS